LGDLGLSGGGHKRGRKKQFFFEKEPKNLVILGTGDGAGLVKRADLDISNL
jgi:hypothetical protein